jgi:hypothetical protein
MLTLHFVCNISRKWIQDFASIKNIVFHDQYKIHFQVTSIVVCNKTYLRLYGG